jgi:nicotinic acid phosphoribosyltransferase
MKEAILLTDGYKLDHRRQYPENTEYVYSNWTPRSCHYYPKEQEDKSCLQTVFEDGKLVKEWSLRQIRDNVNNSIVLED